MMFLSKKQAAFANPASIFNTQKKVGSVNFPR